MRRSLWVGVLAVGMLLAALPSTEAWAAPSTTPTITSPITGTVVAATPVTATVTSSAAKVSFDLTLGLGHLPLDTQVVDVVGGEAAAQIDVAGLSGAWEIWARDCSGAGVCSDTVSSVDVTINLDPPVISAPFDGQHVGNSLEVTADAPGGLLEVSIGDSPKGFVVPGGSPLKVSLKDLRQGKHTVRVKQCNLVGNYCHGKSDSVVVVKDIDGPQWSHLHSSIRRVYPVDDGYRDSVVLTAQVDEAISTGMVEIIRSSGEYVRTIKLTAQVAGAVAVRWDGRRANGQMAPKGKYIYRFRGEDLVGNSSRSDEKTVYVRDERLVKETHTKTVAALSHNIGDYSGDCSRAIAIDALDGYGRIWRSGIQLQSNAKRRCSGKGSIAMVGFRVDVGGAVRYGSLEIATYGGASLDHGGSARMRYVKNNQTWGAQQTLSRSVKWHSADRVKLNPYVDHGRVVWAVMSERGDWYDIKQFRVSYSVWVLK